MENKHGEGTFKKCMYILGTYNCTVFFSNLLFGKLKLTVLKNYIIVSRTKKSTCVGQFLLIEKISFRGGDEKNNPLK